MCLLRSEGREGEAKEIEASELASAIVEARRSSDSDAEADAILRDLFAEGEERVADAVAFAEVLLPMLAPEIRPTSPAMKRAADNFRQRKPGAQRSDEPREIADFIDEMLAQDGAARR